MTCMRNIQDVGEHGVFKELKEDQYDSSERTADGVESRKTSRKHSIEGQARRLKTGTLKGFGQEDSD